MTSEALIRAVPPPAESVQAFTGPWEPVEAYLGTELPSDYKDIAQLYGRGRFMDFVTINLPGDRDRRGSLEGELHMAREMINLGVSVRYPAWPDPGGLLNIGFTALNDRLFWLPRGAPSEWRVVVWDRASRNFETFDCDLTDFIAGLVNGAIRPEGFPDNLLTGARSFTPLSSLARHASTETPSRREEAQPARRGIEALTEVVPPPSEPFQSFGGPWEPLEAYLGTALPRDYKDFARLYGSGLFMDFLIVHVPQIKDSRLTLEPQVRDAPMMFSPREDLSYAFWPRVDGLIRFGCTEEGDQLYWLPEGTPDDWKIVMWQRHGRYDQPFEEFDCGLAEFLGGLASGAIIPRPYGPERLEPYEPMFQPYTERS